VFLRLQRVRNYIALRAHEDMDVAKLAQMAGYSLAHFITMFRCVFGETPYASIGRHRMENASALLSQSALGVADIAFAIGFSSRSSFTRAMKKQLGMSATEFRTMRGD
jgi:AraC-like DNA-binding protein